jgi:hypothetical protein
MAKSKFAEFVHEYRPGRYVVARWVEGNAQYQAPMTADARRLTGCSTVFARTLEGIGNDPSVYRYKRRASALARARVEYGDEVKLMREGSAS